MMPKKCCLYEKDGRQFRACTTDPKCPDLRGWTRIGSWGVEDCHDCLRAPKPPPDKDEDEIEKVQKAMIWLKENWPRLFPRIPIPPPFEII